jgi:hypothetical protein
MVVPVNTTVGRLLQERSLIVKESGYEVAPVLYYLVLLVWRESLLSSEFIVRMERYGEFI